MKWAYDGSAAFDEAFDRDGEARAHYRGIVSVLDGHPATLAWLGGVYGHRTKTLGVEHFGQTGSLAELHRHYGLDANTIMHAAQAVAPGRPVRHLRALP